MTDSFGLTFTFNHTDKQAVYEQAVGTAGEKVDLGRAQALGSAVSTLVAQTPGGTHVSGSVFLTFSATSLSGSISMSAHPEVPVAVPEVAASAVGVSS